MRLLVLGAGSDMGLAIATKFARDLRADLILAARDPEKLEKRAKDLELRFNIKAELKPFEALDYNAHQAFYDSLTPKPDAVLVAYGDGGHQKKGQSDFAELRKIIETNFLSAAGILEIIAADFEARGYGTIMAISSVAGDRGRKNNYLYGSSKAGLTAFLSGLRGRLFEKNVQVMTILPGFVRTKMVQGLDLPEKLVGEPEDVANQVFTAYLGKKDVVYTPGKWRWIMFVIRHIPEFLFKKLSI